MERNPDMTQVEWIGTGEVAKRLRRSMSAVMRLIANGYLHPDRSDSRLRFDVAEVERLRQAMTRGRTAWVVSSKALGPVRGGS